MIQVSEGDTVTLKRKNGRKLTGCKVEKVIRDHGILYRNKGFVYSRKNQQGTFYSQVWLDELEELHHEQN